VVNINLSEIISVGVGVVATGAAWLAKNKGWLDKLLPWLKKPITAAEDAAQTVVTDVEHLIGNVQAQAVIKNLQDALNASLNSSQAVTAQNFIQSFAAAAGTELSKLTPQQLIGAASMLQDAAPAGLKGLFTVTYVEDAIKAVEDAVAGVAGNSKFKATQEFSAIASTSAPKA
jgi:hypothetical protein